MLSLYKKKTCIIYLTNLYFVLIHRGSDARKGGHVEDWKLFKQSSKYKCNMNGCFSFCLTSCIPNIFSKTEQYFLLLDKLLPDSVMASSRSEENVVLNNFQHKRCISVGIP